VPPPPPDEHADEVGDDVERVGGPVGEDEALDHLAEPGVDGEADDDEPGRQPGEQAEEDRHGEDEEVDELVGSREQRDAGRPRRVEDDELDDGGEEGEDAEGAGRAARHLG
jgi:hypothetical protein